MVALGDSVRNSQTLVNNTSLAQASSSVRFSFDELCREGFDALMT